MSEKTAIINAIENIAEATGKTTTAIAKLKEIKRTTGISKKQKKNLIRESETNIELATKFADFCQKNPGILYMQTVGNIFMSNIGQILEYATKTVTSEEMVPDVSLDCDWIVRFLDIAGQTSDQEKQKILADVLIGKIRKPETISYRTLRILQDLTKKEIALFYKALNAAFYGPGYAFIPRPNNKMTLMTTSELMILDECGLLDSSNSKCLNLSGEIQIFSCNKKHLLKLTPKHRVDVNCNYFTESALELIPFIKINPINEDLIIQSAKNMENINLGLELYRIICMTDNKVTYSNINLIR